MATQLTLVNNVLRRLREDTVTSVADNAYSQLIAMWLNDGIREVSETYDWNSLTHTINVAIADGTSTYDLSATVANSGNVDNADRVTTLDSMLRFDMCNRPLCWLWDDSSADTPNNQMTLITEDERLRKYNLDRDETETDPTHFSLLMNTDGDGYQMKLYPEPDAARHLRIVFNTPQAEMAIDGTDDATEVIVPNAVVEAYVHMVASNERGEEIGEPGNMLERRYNKVLGGAIEAAMTVDQRSNVYESRRD